MKKAHIALIIVLVSLLFIVSGCKQKECKVDVDCQQDHFSGRCVASECSYIPIPNECGNDRCEAGVGENECSCPQDCGFCDGPAQGTQYLELGCDVSNQCTTDLMTGNQQLKTHTSQELRSAGDVFRVESQLNDPFNVKRDQMDVLVYLTTRASTNSGHIIEGIDIEAKGEDGRTIILASKSISKPILDVGRDNGVSLDVRLDFATGLVEESVRDIRMKVRYKYVQTTSSGSLERTPSPLTNILRNVEFTYVIPTATYACPASCDDGNPGTNDVCDASTDFFCVNVPKAGVCGNFVCDDDENSCNCETDCGVCSKETAFLRYACEQSQCKASVKSGISKSAQTIGPVEFGQSGFQVRTTYTYSVPFDASVDTVLVRFEVVQMSEDIGKITIKEVRASEAGVLLGRSQSSQELTTVGGTVEIRVPLDLISDAQSEKIVLVEGDYEYTRNGQAQPLTQFRKSLNKATYLSP